MIARKVFLALLVLVIVQVIVYYPQLPEPVASHFDGSGQPNGWMSRNVFFGVHFGVVAVMALSFLFLPSRLRFISYKTWSIPNRDYWLAPERVDETLRVIQNYMLWCGVVSVAFLITVIQMTIDANLNPPAVLSGSIRWLLIAFFVFIFAWVFRLIARFSRVSR